MCLGLTVPAIIREFGSNSGEATRFVEFAGDIRRVGGISIKRMVGDNKWLHDKLEKVFHSI